MSNKMFWLVVKIPNFIVSRFQQNDRIGAMFGGNILFFYSVFIKRVSYLIPYTDRSNENGTLTNKPYWNEGTLNGDKIH